MTDWKVGPTVVRIAYHVAMSRIDDCAVVLTRLDYSETSQVVALFTREHGKVRAIAKGIKRGTKKRFAVGLDLFDVGEVALSHRIDRPTALATLSSWRQTASSSGLRESLDRLYAGQYVLEITSHLTEDWDPHPELYDALIDALTCISNQQHPLFSTWQYQIRLLSSIGSRPAFDRCVPCGRHDDLTHFSSFEGGMICRDCEATLVEKREVSEATRRLCQKCVEGEENRVAASGGAVSAVESVGAGSESEAFAGPFSLLNYHISHLMGKEPKLACKIVSRGALRGV